MSRAEELARQSENLADARLELDGYEWSVDADVQLRMNADELRRLSAVEAELEALKKTISEAEPVAWLDDFGNAFPIGARRGAGSWVNEHQRDWKPLYTLKGIK